MGTCVSSENKGNGFDDIYKEQQNSREQSVDERQKRGGIIYMQQGVLHDSQGGGNQGQLQVKRKKGKGKDKSGKRKNDKKNDQSHYLSSENASGGIDPREVNGMQYYCGSHVLYYARPSASVSEKRKVESKEELERMKELLSRKDRELDTLRQGMEGVRRDADEKIRKVEEELKGKTEKINQLEAENNDLMKRKVEWKEEAERMKQYLEKTKKEADETISNFEEELKRNKEEFKQVEAEKNDLLLRLSSEAALKMTYNNPNITNLSDQDRPTKITERYTELYDNQWTDSFENLQTIHHMSDTEAIQLLLDVLYISFKECKKIRKQRKNLEKYIIEYVGAVEGDVTVLEVMTILKDAKKKNVAKMLKDYTKNVQEYLEKKYREKLQCIRPYFEECVEICLLMNIQEPAMELLGLVLEEKTNFDVSRFKAYTKSGSRIEHMVWPALALYKDGPLLCKGVAQGMRGSSAGYKLSSVEDHENKEEHQSKVSGRQEESKLELTKDQEPNSNNYKTEERITEEKKQVQALSNSRSSGKEKRSQQPYKNIETKSQTQHEKPGCSPGRISNHTSTKQMKDAEDPPQKIYVASICFKPS